MSDVIQQLPNLTSHSPTINAVVRSRYDLPADTQTFRRYVSHVAVRKTTERDLTDGDRKILYRVGGRSLAAREAIRSFDPKSYQTPQVFKLNDALFTQLSAIVGKHNNFRASFEFCDLACVAQTLGRAIGYYTNTGQLTCANIRNGQGILVRSLATPSHSIQNANTVFIPHPADPETGEHVFAVLAAAVNNAGVSVVTDYINVHGNNAPVVNEPIGMAAFKACWIGVKCLMQQAMVSGAGASMAVAFLTGIYDSMTVVAHTDEGGLMRDILRNVRYQAPRGAIWRRGWRKYQAMAALSINPTLIEVQGVVDGLALVTAASTALGDPLSEVDGMLFPSISTARAVGADEAARNTSMGNGHLAYLRGHGHLLCNGVAAEMAKCLGCHDGSNMAGEAVRVGLANLTPECRHLHFEVIAPAYWIEPTSLFDTLDGSAATKAGYGLVCGRTSWKQFEPYEVTEVLGANDLTEYLRIKWRSARTVGIVLGGLGDMNNILADVAPREVSANDLTCFAGGEDLFARMVAADRLTTYLWQHSACWLPAPAEVLNTAGSMGIKIYKRQLDEDCDFGARTRFPAEEWAAGSLGSVALIATRPMMLSVGKAGSVPRDIRRVINRASRACQRRQVRVVGQFSNSSSLGTRVMPVTAGPAGDPAG